MKTNLRLIASLSTVSLALVATAAAAERTPTGTYSDERTISQRSDPLSPAERAPVAQAEIADDIGAWSVASSDEIKGATFAKRGEVREQLKAAQAKLDLKIQEWEAKKNGLDEEAKAVAEPTLVEMRNARDWLVRETDSVGDATAETWTSVKHKVNVAWQKVRSAHEKLDSRLRS